MTVHLLPDVAIAQTEPPLAVTSNALITPQGDAVDGTNARTIQPQIQPSLFRHAQLPTGRFVSSGLFTYKSQYDGETKPEWRSFGFYVPDNLQPGEKVPLVVGLHGYGQNCGAFAVQSGLKDLAQQHRFAFLCPDALPNYGPVSRHTAVSVNQPPALSMRGWNAGDCCGDPKRDDEAFILDLINEVKRSCADR